MLVLLDECLPKKLKHELSGHEVWTVPERKWAGLKNGALLRRAAKHFDVMITFDHSLEHQQNFDGLDLAIVVLVALRNDIDLLRPLMPAVRETLPKLVPGELVHIGAIMVPALGRDSKP